MKILKCLLMIVTAPAILVLTIFVWLCTGLIYISSLVLGLLSTVIALLGVAVLITYSPQNGAILLVMAFLISPMGLPLAAIWLLSKECIFLYVKHCCTGFVVGFRKSEMKKQNP